MAIRVLHIVLLSLLLGGCAGPQKLVLRLNLAQTAESRTTVFPPPGDIETPRYAYIGELLGEQNFVVAEPQKENVFIRALKWLVGVFDNPNLQTLQRPQSGVVDADGRILVTDVSRGGVYVFDSKAGRLDIWEFATHQRRFQSPTGIALDPQGRIFVADGELGAVYVLDSQGHGIAVIGQGKLQRPTGLVFDASARLLYVADTQAHHIVVFDPQGNLVRTIGERGGDPGSFNFPTYLALRHGKLLVTDTMNARIQVIDLEGEEPPLVVGRQGTRKGEFVRPKGVAVDSENNIYAVESYYDHLLIYNAKGEFLLPIGGTGKEIGRFFLPSGVWIDDGNRVFVADTFNGRIAIFQFLGGGDESE